MRHVVCRISTVILVNWPVTGLPKKRGFFSDNVFATVFVQAIGPSPAVIQFKLVVHSPEIKQSGRAV
jgi:hypothetical protein